MSLECGEHLAFPTVQLTHARRLTPPGFWMDDIRLPGIQAPRLIDVAVPTEGDVAGLLSCSGSGDGISVGRLENPVLDQMGRV